MTWLKDGKRFTQRYYAWCKAQPVKGNVIARCYGDVTGPFGEMPFPDAFVDELKRLGIPFERYRPVILGWSPVTTGIPTFLQAE